MAQRKSLSEILDGANKEALAKTWGETQAAADFAPLPRGEYEAMIIAGELFTARTGTPGYKLTLETSEGDYKGRRFWCDLWLTSAAMPMTKRDLAKIGVTELVQLERPLPARIRCRVKLALRKNDEGAEYNHVSRFEVMGVEAPDPLELSATTSEGKS